MTRLLLENVLRRSGSADAAAGKAAILDWLATGTSEAEIPFVPGRVLMHDTTCGPALVDIAGDARGARRGGGRSAPRSIRCCRSTSRPTTRSPSTVTARPTRSPRNMERELGRNAERYRFMKWATRALEERPRASARHRDHAHASTSSAWRRWSRPRRATAIAGRCPTRLIGTDSHTPMINGIGVLGWGVGGLEAESVLFGMPVMLRVPEVSACGSAAACREGSLSTDLALTVTERLRRLGLSGQFVEFFGPGVPTLSAGDRAVVANMAPEYGATRASSRSTSRRLPIPPRPGARRRKSSSSGLREAAGALVRSRG